MHILLLGVFSLKLQFVLPWICKILMILIRCLLLILSILYFGVREICY